MDTDIKNNILKTGTSLVGIVCKDGVVMAGDRRTTLGGQIVVSKKTLKVCPINDYLIVSGTGTASDIDSARKMIRAQLKLKELRERNRPTVSEAANLIAVMNYKNIRQPSMIPFMAGLMVGGVNEDGMAELFSVGPDGSIMQVEDYDANFSSGMPYILGMLEKNYKADMSIEDGIKLAIDAIKSSSQRDTASGNGVDVFTLTKDGIKQVAKQTIESVYKEQ